MTLSSRRSTRGYPRSAVDTSRPPSSSPCRRDSDVIEALTTYINDDPAARAWLNGSSSGEPSVCNSAGHYQVGGTDPCPAMVVNPAYKGISLPVDQWPLLSTWVSQGYDANPSVQFCLQSTPEPFDSLLAARHLGISRTSAKRCSSTMPTRRPPARRTLPTCRTPFLLPGPSRQGTTSCWPSAHWLTTTRYNLQTAELQTTAGSFVGPSDSSLEEATGLLQPDSSTGTWPIPYAGFETAAGAAAYPGTMVVYAAVPTSGLPAGDASDYAALLTFAAGPGQTPGEGVGQLPPGYLPLTAADGLGGLAAYTLAAAADVAAQNGQVPPLVPAAGGPSGTDSASSSGSSPSGSSAFGGNGLFLDAPFGSGSDSAEGTASAGKAAAGRASSAKVLFVQLPSVTDTALWTKDVSVGLLLGLAMLVALAVLTALLLGRQRQRW